MIVEADWSGQARLGKPAKRVKMKPESGLPRYLGRTFDTEFEKSMRKVDAATIGRQAVKLGLITATQLKECHAEAGKLGSDAGPLLRALERRGYLSPWQSAKLVKGDSDGYLLGEYRLLYKIASGSFGRVYRADEPSSGNVVAIKVLRRRWSDNPRNIEQFEREGAVGRSLRHPNIVSILEVARDSASSQYYIVMEFVEGGNLRDFLAIRKKLEPAEALRLIQDTAAGLAYAYSRGLTHRDIKPTNILISSQGEAKLVDFGLAALSAGQGESDGGKIDRTIDYAGLEMATGVKPGDVRSDIYFLGCVLYEMLTGRPPLLMTKDRRARMDKQRFGNVVPIDPKEVPAPPKVLHLVHTMMALSPQQRYQTPSFLLEAIRDARREFDNSATSESVAPPTERSVFVVEKNERLKDILREKLKKMGYRVFIAGDPANVMARFRQQPFDALVVDAGTVGEEGVFLFKELLDLAERQKLPCVGIMMLSEDQAGWGDNIQQGPKAVVLVRPVTLGQLCTKLGEMMAPSLT